MRFMRAISLVMFNDIWVSVTRERDRKRGGALNTGHRERSFSLEIKPTCETFPESFSNGLRDVVSRRTTPVARMSAISLCCLPTVSSSVVCMRSVALGRNQEQTAELTTALTCRPTGRNAQITKPGENYFA